MNKLNWHVVLSVTKEEKIALKHLCAIEGMTLKVCLTKAILDGIGGNDDVDQDIPIPAKSKMIIKVIKKED